MTKGDISNKYKHMSTEDRRTFDRWLRANLVVGSFMAVALVAMALIGSNSTGSRQPVAESIKAELAAK